MKNVNTKYGRSAIIITTFLSLTIVIATLQFVMAIEWSEPSQLTTDTEYDVGPSVLETLDGSIWVVWSSDRTLQYELYYKTSPDYGGSWSGPFQLTSNSSHDMDVSVIQVSNGSIWVVWASDRTGNYDVFYKTSANYGGSWSDPFQLTTNSSLDWNPSVIQVSNGSIWVVWASDRTGNFDLFYKTSPDHGLSWFGPFQLTTHLKTDLAPCVIQVSNGSIWVVWASYRTGNYDIFYKTSPDYGFSWFGPFPLTTDPAWDTQPFIIQAVDGSIWVVYSSGKIAGKYDVFYMTSPDIGLTWPTEDQLTTDQGLDQSPSAANINSERIMVAWYSDRTTDYEVFYTISDVIPIHDVAITDITLSDTVVRPGEIISIDVVAENQGNQDETFTVELYADSTSIGSETITLANKTSTTLNFSWNTIDFSPGRYTISATASVVSGENTPNTDDNTFTDGTVLVTLLGDVDGDGDIDLFDLTRLLWAYGTVVGDDLYDPDADFDDDGDVDLSDLYWVIWNYGQAV